MKNASHQRQGGRLWGILFSGFVLAAALMTTPSTATAATDVGYRDFSYSDSNTPSAPSGSKPESKLWWNDGFWWASLYDAGSNGFHIFKLDRTTQAWVDTGTPLDPRWSSRADVLWDGAKLYVASHVFSSSAGATAAPSYLYRYSYSSASKSYSLDSAFPATINNYRTETLVIDKDSTGTLWATWTQGSSTTGYKVWVNRSTTSDAVWGTPFVVPTVKGVDNLTSDDISSVVAFGGNKIGVMWSNQTDSAMYFAVHNDSDPDTTWQGSQTAVQGPNNADDHINLKSLQADATGRVFAAVKTSLTSSQAPLINLLVRSSDGTWTSYRFGRVADSHTRPIVLLDEEHNILHMFATGPSTVGTSGQSGGTIYEKTTPINNISFADGVGTPVIQDGSSSDMNNVTSTKQNVNSTTGLVILASNDNTHYYWHNDLSLGSAPGDTQSPSTPTNLNGNASSSTSVDLTWTASTDNVGVTGYTVYRDGISVGTPTGPSYTDTTVTADTTYIYTVDAYDAAGNHSTKSASKSITTPSGTPSSGTITFRSATSGANATATSLVLNNPAGTSAGDVLLAAVSMRGYRPATAPAGWNLVRSDVNGTSMIQSLFAHFAGANEPASYTWSFAQAQAASGAIVSYIGVDTSSPVDASSGQANASSASITAPSLTAAAAGERLVGFFGIASTATITAPPGMAERAEASSTAGTYKVGTEASDVTLTAVGATGARTASASGSAANVGQLVALRPGSAPSDTQSPSIPTNLNGSASSSTSVDLTWTASTDNVGVTGYTIYRDGSKIGTADGTTYSDMTTTASTTYSYTVDAYDAAGNHSAQSTAKSVTTPSAPPAGSGITLVGSNSGANAGEITLSLANPQTATAGDVLIAAIDMRGYREPTGPAGWTEVRSDVVGTTMIQSVWLYVVTASEPTTYVWTFYKAQAASGIVLAYRGVDTANPVDGHSGAAGDGTADITAPSVTATAAGDQLIGFYGIARSATFTAPTGMTLREQSVSDASTYKVSSGSADQALSVAGSTGIRTARASGAGTGIGELVVLRAAP